MSSDADAALAGFDAALARAASAAWRTDPAGFAAATGELGQVEAHLAAVAASVAPFEVVLRGTASFRPVSPVVYVPLVEGGEQCGRLEQLVRSGPLAREVAFADLYSDPYDLEDVL